MYLLARPIDRESYPTVHRLCRLHEGPRTAVQADIWQTLWDVGRPFGVAVSDLSEPGKSSDVAALVAVYIHDWAVNHIVSATEPYALQSLVRQTRLSRNPFLTKAEIAASNAKEGLNLYICYMGWEADTEQSFGLRAVLLNSFADRHGGDRLKLILGETCNRSMRSIAKRMGLTEINAYELKANDIVGCADDGPCLVGVDRAHGIQRESPFLARLFTYFAPKLFFTDPQREILILAREGYTDSEIAGMIGVSQDAVKKRWVAIYEKVADQYPGLLPKSEGEGRGVEKRRQLLARLRERPEELRPFDRRVGG